jgi:hypothetical protein
LCSMSGICRHEAQWIGGGMEPGVDGKRMVGGGGMWHCCWTVLALTIIII